MKYLFFDTETDGLPKNYKASMTDTDNWPRLVQIGWIIYDDKKVLEETEYVIYPDGFTIPKQVSDIHRVTQERAKLEGVPLIDVLQELKGKIDSVDILVGHNITFDVNIVGSEFIRCGIDVSSMRIHQICTMKSSTEYCKLPGNWGKYKWPKLMELHTKLFGKGFEEAHDAIADIRATVKCFFELVDRGVIQP